MLPPMRLVRPTTLALACATILVACSSGSTGSKSDAVLSPFVEDTPISGRVLENSTACEVDAACYLRIEFADTSLVALYGTGERPAPECEMSREVSNVGFQVEPGEIVTVVVSMCGSDGYYLRELDRDAA